MTDEGIKLYKDQHHCIDDYVIGRAFVDDVADWKIFLSLCGPREVLEAMICEKPDGKGFYIDERGTFYDDGVSSGVYHFYMCDVEMASPLLEGPPAHKLLPDNQEADKNKHTHYLTIVANVEYCEWEDEEDDDE